jgi:hypothetical protein
MDAGITAGNVIPVDRWEALKVEGLTAFSLSNLTRINWKFEIRSTKCETNPNF